MNWWMLIAVMSLALNCWVIIVWTQESLSASRKSSSNNSRKTRSTKPVPQQELVLRSVSPAQRGVLTGLSVLVAEDQPTNVTVLVEMLKEMGLTSYVVAGDGEEAVRYSRQKQFDIVFMDIQMPKINGIDAAKSIHSILLNKTTPIIPITGFSRIVNADLCRKAGMTGFLQKPIDFDKLKSAIRLALAGRRSPVAVVRSVRQTAVATL